MRPHIPHLDTESMDWTSPIPGLYSKVLSLDPDNGARTAIQRLVPAEGYSAPTVPHYHHSAEEILVLGGKLSFDSKTYLGAKGYCFHPPETVHGFQSDVPEETMFLSRHSKKMCTHDVPEPAKREYYPLTGKMPDRAWAALPNAAADGWEGNVKVLGEDLARRGLQADAFRRRQSQPVGARGVLRRNLRPRRQPDDRRRRDLRQGRLCVLPAGLRSTVLCHRQEGVGVRKLRAGLTGRRVQEFVDEGQSFETGLGEIERLEQIDAEVAEGLVFVRRFDAFGDQLDV